MESVRKWTAKLYVFTFQHCFSFSVSFSFRFGPCLDPGLDGTCYLRMEVMSAMTQMWEWDHLSTPLLVFSIHSDGRVWCVCVCCVVERHHHNSSLWAHLQVLTVPSPKGISPRSNLPFLGNRALFSFSIIYSLSLSPSLCFLPIIQSNSGHDCRLLQ